MATETLVTAAPTTPLLAFSIQATWQTVVIHVTLSQWPSAKFVLWPTVNTRYLVLIGSQCKLQQTLPDTIVTRFFYEKSRSHQMKQKAATTDKNRPRRYLRKWDIEKCPSMLLWYLNFELDDQNFSIISNGNEQGLLCRTGIFVFSASMFTHKDMLQWWWPVRWPWIPCCVYILHACEVWPDQAHVWIASKNCRIMHIISHIQISFYNKTHHESQPWSTSVATLFQTESSEQRNALCWKH